MEADPTLSSELPAPLREPAPEPPAEEPATRHRSASRRTAMAAGLVLVAGLLGTAGGAALQASRGSETSPTTAALTPAAAQVPGGAGQDDPGTTAGDDRPLGAPPGGVAGEQRLLGTVQRVTATSIAVQTGSGARTFGVTSRTQIQRDGQPIRLTDLKAGETVLLHVYPSGSGYLAERVLAGTGGIRFGPGAQPEPSSSAQRA